MTDSISILVIRFLEKRGFSFREMAEAVKVSPSEVSRINDGKRKWTLNQLEMLADHFKLELWEFLLAASKEMTNSDLNAEIRNYLQEAIGRMENERIVAA